MGPSSFFSHEVGLVIARYVGVGGGPDGEEGATTVHQFSDCLQGIACKLVVVLIVGQCLDGCLIVHTDVDGGQGVMLVEQSESFMNGMEFSIKDFTSAA
jgi:hypothetical protein